jgi:hypothetical protein
MSKLSRETSLRVAGEGWNRKFVISRLGYPLEYAVTLKSDGKFGNVLLPQF